MLEIDMAVDHKTMERLINEAQSREAQKLMEEIERGKVDKWRTHQDYDRGFLDYLHREVQSQWAFMSWLKQTYPEALEAWVALNKLKGE
jgi:hypothetical protein